MLKEPLHTEMIHENLKQVMSEEVSTMRELLSNMEQEREALLTNNMSHLKDIMDERKTLFHQIVAIREGRIMWVKKLVKSFREESIDDGQCSNIRDFHELLKDNGSHSCEILCLRDQILSLMERMNTQNSRNNYLLTHKILRTYNFLESLTPSARHNTYQDTGYCKPKQRLTTLNLLNREI